jgi:AcrR family transcriptional regulator
MPRAGLDSAAVVDAAAAMADRDGLRALTLARLAAELGVRSPSLYAHVDGLEDLRARLAARGARELAGTLQLAAAGRAGSDALQAVSAAYRTYAHAHPGTYAALQRTDLDDPETTAAGELVLVVMLAVLRGYGLDGDNAVHGVRIIRAALHGFVALEAERGFGIPLDLDDSFERLVATLHRGLSGN